MACSGSRHMACRLCRERKVRCDGDVPTCGRCARAGENCIYAAPSNPSKADLIETVETVQDRLNKAEASLAAMQSRERARSARGIQDPIFSGIPMTADGLTMPADGSTMPQCFEDPVPLSSDPTNVFEWNSVPAMANLFPLDTGSAMNHNRRASGPPVFANLTKDKASSNMAQASDSSGDNRSSNSSRKSLPSLMDVRRWIAAPAVDLHTPNESAVLASFKEFMMSALTNQAKIAGVAAAMADYISWTRRPGQGGGPVNGDVLEMFEARAREIVGLAETDGQRAYQQVEATIGQLPPHEQAWRTFDVEVAQRKGRLSMFFDKTYDIYTPLNEQR